VAARRRGPLTGATRTHRTRIRLDARGVRLWEHNAMATDDQRPARLFFSVVVVGARLAGCGGQASDDGEDAPARSSSGANPPVGAPTSSGASPLEPEIGSSSPQVPDDCAFPQQFSCANGFPSATADGCVCDERAPLDASDCASDLEFACDGSVGFHYYGCQCDEALGNHLASLCEPQAALYCEQFLPRHDRCACDADAPTSQEDCEPDGVLKCQSMRPVFGCRCDRFTGIR
jgi:hypothetical protein